MSLPRLDHATHIADQLNELAAKVKTRSRASLTDANRILETIAARFFNGLFRWDLVNLNTEQPNYPAADLGDGRRRIAIQVTNEGGSDKIKHTASKAVEHRLGADFDRLIIFFLLPKKPSFPKQFTQPPHGPEVETWDITDLLKQMQDLSDLDALARAAKVLDEEMGKILESDSETKFDDGWTKARNAESLHSAIRLANGTWFIEREAERKAITHLRNLRITVTLRGGRQLGKTLCARRIGQQMAAESWRPVSVDLRDEFAAVDYETGHGLLRRLAEKIADQTNSDHTLLTVFDRDGTPTAFKTYVDALRDKRPDFRMLLRLDRVDALAGRACCSVVLSGLRVLHNAQCELGKHAWLQMLLIHTITPRQTGESLGSIFDVAKVVEVTDFSNGELQKLAALYDLSGLDTSKLHSFLGGHPALSELAFEAIREDHKTLDQIIADSKTGGIFKQHLDRLTKEFRALPNAKRLADSFRGLLQGNALDSEETFDALLALGVVKGTYSGDAEVRCELYKAWLSLRIPR